MPSNALPQSMARKIASRHLMASRIASRYLQASRVAKRWVKAKEQSLPDLFDETEGQKKVKNPATGRKVKLKSLKRHKDKSVRKVWDKAYGAWAKKQKGEEEKTTGATRKKLDKFLKGIKGASKKVVESVKNAPEATQKFVADKEYRNEAMKAAGAALKSNAKKVGVRAWQALKDEAHATFVESPKIVHTLFKEKRLPSKKEFKTLYGTAVYAGGVGLAVIPTLPAIGGAAAAGSAAAAGAAIGGMLYTGGAAFANSFALHVGFKTFSYMFEPDSKFDVDPETAERISNADEALLGVEAVETVAGADAVIGSGAVMAWLAENIGGTSDLYLPTLLAKAPEIAKMILASRVAADDENDGDDEGDEGGGDDLGGMSEDEVMGEFMTKFMEVMGEVMEQGFSDEEMEAVLTEDTKSQLVPREESKV